MPDETRRFLAEVGQVLATSLDYEQTLHQVARLAVPRIADWCAVDVVGDNGEIQRLAIAHVDPAKERTAADMAARYPPVAGAAARARAEAAERRAAFLAEVGSVLATSLDHEVTLDNVARLAVSSIADICPVDVVEDDTGLKRVATAHRDPSTASLLGQTCAFPPDLGQSPLARPLRRWRWRTPGSTGHPSRPCAHERGSSRSSRMTCESARDDPQERPDTARLRASPRGST